MKKAEIEKVIDFLENNNLEEITKNAPQGLGVLTEEKVEEYVNSFKNALLTYERGDNFGANLYSNSTASSMKIAYKVDVLEIIK